MKTTLWGLGLITLLTLPALSLAAPGTASKMASETVFGIPDGERRDWPSAQAFCQHLALAKLSWSLPGLSELQALYLATTKKELALSAA